MDLALGFIMVCRTRDLTACGAVALTARGCRSDSRGLHALLLVARSLSCLGLPFLGAPDLAFFFFFYFNPCLIVLFWPYILKLFLKSHAVLLLLFQI